MLITPRHVFGPDQLRVHGGQELREVVAVRDQVRVHAAQCLTPDHALKEVVGVRPHVGPALRVPPGGALEVVNGALAVALRHLLDERQGVNGQLRHHLGVPER
ncbi:hypothetical protein [Streptomyces nitrosporeus]|uniref:hypothetical protein n=1 Tax=Streptomyces nitrosporeus TaxID=28894 RepID=UPI003D9FA09D